MTLTGRDLDRAVARVLGLDGTDDDQLAAYSSPDCSGMGPVVQWLVENGQGFRMKHYPDGWACYFLGESSPVTFHSTLPEVVCLLAVAWHKRKAG